MTSKACLSPEPYPYHSIGIRCAQMNVWHAVLVLGRALQIHYTGRLSKCLFVVCRMASLLVAYGPQEHHLGTGPDPGNHKRMCAVTLSGVSRPGIGEKPTAWPLSAPVPEMRWPVDVIS